MPSLRLLPGRGLLALLVAVACVLPATAAGAEFAGSSISQESGRASGDVSLTISNGKVTAASVRFLPICAGGVSVAGTLHLAGAAVPAVGGTVSVPLQGTLTGYSDVVTGTLVLDGASEDAPSVSGHVSASTVMAGFGTACSMERDVLLAADVDDGAGPDASDFFGTPPEVAFDVADGRVRNLWLDAAVDCGSVTTFRWWGPGRGVWQVPVDQDGGFRAEGWSLTEYGDAAHFVLTGRLGTGSASGTLVVDVPGFRVTGCTGVRQSWYAAASPYWHWQPPTAPSPPGPTPPAATPAPVPPLPVTAKPQAELQLFAFRRTVRRRVQFGLVMGRVSCHEATHVQLAGAGRTRLVSCQEAAGQAYTGIAIGLTPGARYTLRVTPMRMAGGQAVASGDTTTQDVRLPKRTARGWRTVRGTIRF